MNRINRAVESLIRKSLLENLIYNEMTSGQVPNLISKEVHDWIGGTNKPTDKVINLMNAMISKNSSASTERIVNATTQDIYDGLEVNDMSIEKHLIYGKVDEFVKLFLTKH